MVTATTKEKDTKDTAKAKPKAQRADVTHLEVLTAHTKVFSSGKTGWFGKVVDPVTRKRYQIIGAVQLDN